MSTAIVGLSRYFLVIFIAFYTFHCFIVFGCRNEREREAFYISQNIFMIMIHVLGFAVLAIEDGSSDLMFLCAFQEIMFFAVIILYRIIYPDASKLLVNNMCMLLAISFIMLTRLSSAQRMQDQTAGGSALLSDKGFRQFIIVAVTLAATMVITYMVSKIKFIKRFTWWFGISGIVILLAVMTAGTVTNGSKLTISIGAFSFQPSEFVKILFVFFIAGMLSESTDIIQLASVSITAAAHVLILVFSKDLGGALIFFVVYVFMIYAATKKPVCLVGGAAGGVLATFIGYRLFAHVRTRFVAWRDPWSVIQGQGYQITQSLFAIGTGSWFGMGLMQGSPDKIPIVAADFIFSAISEEMGCLFSLCMVLICISNFLMFMNISMAVSDNYYRLISLGLAVNYGFQMFLTVGGVTKFIPLTGVTLPLVSYGGTSVLSTLIMFSIIQGIYIMRYSDD